MRILSKQEQRTINAGGPGGSGAPITTGCTGDVDGNPDTTWDKFCYDHETEN